MFATNRFRLGGIALLILAWACVAAPAPAHAVTLTIDEPTVTEGDAGTTYATFTVTLTSVEAGDVVVDFQTEPGSPADPELDFIAQAGQLTFFAANGETNGQTSKTLIVPVVGDTEDEPIEYFTMELRATNLPDTVVGVATILDDDAAIGIGDVTVTEGSTGTTSANFTVTVSSTDSGDVTVNYATADGTARAPFDYTSQSGTLTFPEFGPLTQTITVPVVGDTLEEAGETFFVNLTEPTNASIADPQGQGTILNDDLAASPPVDLGAEGDEDVNPTVQARVLRGLSLVASKRRVSSSALLRLKGLLRVSGGPASCRSRQKIAIQRRQAGTSRFQTFEVAVTSRSGSFKMSTRPVRTYKYRARVSQTARCMGATSKQAKVVVRKRSKGGSARR